MRKLLLAVFLLIAAPALAQTNAFNILDHQQTFSSTLPGVVPASGGGSTNCLHADGTWSACGGGSSTPGGTSGQIQYNNGGTAFGGFGSYNGTDTVTVPNLTATGGASVTGAATAGAYVTAPSIRSTVATGTPPLVVASTTNVPNLNASSLSGATFASPGAIGGTTAGTGAFTTITASGAATFGATVVNGGALTVSSGTQVSNLPAISVTQTWNNAAVTFTGIKANYIVTASNNAGLFLDLQRGGISQFSVAEFGNIVSTGTLNVTNAILTGSAGARLSSTGLVTFSNSANPQTVIDTGLARNAASVVEVNNGTAGTLAGLKAATYFTSAPVTVATSSYTVSATDSYVVGNNAGTITVTMPTASSFTGRQITFKTIQAQTIVSAASNIVPLVSATPGTAILAGTAGKWAKLVSDGSNWIIMEGN